MAYEKTWQFDTNHAYNPASTAAPALLSVVASAGGGTLIAGTTYFYAVTAIKNGIESVVSNEVWAIALSGGTNTLTWTAVSGATAYNVYRGTTASSYGKWVQLGAVTTYADTNAMNSNPTPTAVPYHAAIDTAKWLLWYYKAFLTGQTGGATLGLWTVAGSSDGVTAGMDGVDRWGSTYDGTKIINNGAGSVHSWFCLKSPLMVGQYYYILIDYKATHFYQVNLSFGAVTAPTGGSTTTAPTMTVPGTLASLVFTLTQIAPSGYWPAGPFRAHGALATDGSFNILVSRNGTRKFVLGFLGHVLADYRAADQFPVWFSYVCDSSLNAGYGNQAGPSGVGPDKIFHNLMRTMNNGNYDLYSLILPTTTNWPAGQDRFDLSFADWPLWVSKRNTGNGFIGIRGRLQDITWLASDYESGTLDDQLSPKYVAVGGSATGNWRFPIDQRILWE